MVLDLGNHRSNPAFDVFSKETNRDLYELMARYQDWVSIHLRQPVRADVTAHWTKIMDGMHYLFDQGSFQQKFSDVLSVEAQTRLSIVQLISLDARFRGRVSVLVWLALAELASEPIHHDQRHCDHLQDRVPRVLDWESLSFILSAICKTPEFYAHVNTMFSRHGYVIQNHGLNRYRFAKTTTPHSQYLPEWNAREQTYLLLDHLLQESLLTIGMRLPPRL